MLSLVEPYYAGAKVYVITTCLGGAFFAFCAMIMASMHGKDLLQAPLCNKEPAITLLQFGIIKGDIDIDMTLQTG